MSPLQFSNDGRIVIETNITDLSRDRLIDIDASIGSVAIGSCGNTIPSNGTAPCLLDQGPNGPVTCAQLPTQSNYTLTIRAYFAPSLMTATRSFPVTASELGCGS